MPLLATAGAASARGFRAYTSTSGAFIVATGGTVYVDPTDVDYKIHEFTADDNFEVTECPDLATIEIMAVAGGGGSQGVGGGGAGGYVWSPSHSISVGSYSVIIGTGGSGTLGGFGADTTFGVPGETGSVWAIGGGYGGVNGQPGGSGGGRQQGGPAAGLQPTVGSGGYGNAGGVDGTAGGGGGAGSAGSGYIGGSGRTADIISSAGTFEVFAAGGYGASGPGVYPQIPTVRANSGNGGYTGVDGQSGIVRIRYQFQ